MLTLNNSDGDAVLDGPRFDESAIVHTVDDFRVYPAVMVETEDGHMDYGAAVEAGYSRGDDGIWRRAGNGSADGDTGDAEHADGQPDAEPVSRSGDTGPLEFLGASGGGGSIPPWAVAVGALAVLWLVTSS